MNPLEPLFNKKNSRKLTKAEKAMCASIVAVCALAAALIFAVKFLLS